MRERVSHSSSEGKNKQQKTERSHTSHTEDDNDDDDERKGKDKGKRKLRRRRGRRRRNNLTKSRFEDLGDIVGVDVGAVVAELGTDVGPVVGDELVDDVEEVDFVEMVLGGMSKVWTMARVTSTPGMAGWT